MLYCLSKKNFPMMEVKRKLNAIVVRRNLSVSQGPIFFLEIFKRNHIDGVPRASFQ